MKKGSLVIASLALTLAFGAGACASGGAPSEQPGSALDVGDEAPGFSLSSASGTPVSLADHLGRRPVLLYFSMGPG
ncbi:MAG: hypothetical protein ACRDH0_14945 [Actinomycetota bacterium]